MRPPATLRQGVGIRDTVCCGRSQRRHSTRGGHCLFHITIMLQSFHNVPRNLGVQSAIRTRYLSLAANNGTRRSLTSFFMSRPCSERGSVKVYVLGSGRTYAVFYQLNKIIPCLRDALSNRAYLYRTEIDEIDDILYDYDYLN